jgi:hypothetical protein
MESNHNPYCFQSVFFFGGTLGETGVKWTVSYYTSTVAAVGVTVVRWTIVIVYKLQLTQANLRRQFQAWLNILERFKHLRCQTRTHAGKRLYKFILYI